MPLYDFKCGLCKYEFEEIVKSYLVQVISCPDCDGPADRVRINKNVNHQFKCGGFYKIDSREDNKRNNSEVKDGRKI